MFFTLLFVCDNTSCRRGLIDIIYESKRKGNSYTKLKKLINSLDDRLFL